MIFQIKIEEEHTEDNINAVKDYLGNCLRHIADTWELDICLHDNPYTVDEDTLT